MPRTQGQDETRRLDALPLLETDDPGLARAYERDGVVLVKDALTTEEIDDLRRNVERYRTFMTTAVPADWVRYEDDGTIGGMYFMERVDPYFAALCARPKLTALVEKITAAGATPMGVETFDKPARVGSPALPHQDGIYFAETTTRITHIWLPLDPVTADNGALQYWPGSHLDGIRPHVPTADPWLVQLPPDAVAALDPPRVAELEPGSVAVHHDRIVHASPQNHSPRSRRAVAISWSLAL